MKKVLGGILLIVYSIIAITVTVLLLSYNDYNCSEIGGYTVFIVNDDSLEPDYKQGSILLIKETSDRNVQIGDEMFLYKVINSQEYELVNRTLEDKVQQGTHITYVVRNEEIESSRENVENYANDYFIGKTSDTIVIDGWGYVLGLLESKWGYLFCVVIVSLLLFLQEVFELVMEIKYGKAEREAEREAERAEKIERARSRAKTRTTRTASNTAETTTAEKPKTASTTRKTGTTKTSASTAKKTGTAKTSATTAKKTSATKASATTAKKTGTAKTSASTTRKTSVAKKAEETVVEDNNEANDEEG